MDPKVLQLQADPGGVWKVFAAGCRSSSLTLKRMPAIPNPLEGGSEVFPVKKK